MILWDIKKMISTSSPNQQINLLKLMMQEKKQLSHLKAKQDKLDIK